jgi:phosphomannomutase
VSGIFKAYDIRGIHGSEMDEDDARLIGRAFVEVLSGLSGKRPGDLVLGLGRDMRLTAPGMASAIRDGMVEQGAQVLDAGMVATEMLYYLVGNRDLDGGAMVTASHNPAAYTGVKLVREGALALSGDAGIGEIEEMIQRGVPEPKAKGRAESVDVGPGFRELVLSLIDPELIGPLRVVVDGGNGMAGPMVGPILDGLPVTVIPTYFEPDGTFPDHEPNPLLEENREAVSAAVVDAGADLGIAWDGDADRCFFIDEGGRFCDGDFICALLARALLERNPGGVVLHDPRSSRAVPDTVSAAGGRNALSRVGHAFFKARMREEDAVFGGEVSGHYYFRDFFSADSGTIPALLMLETLSTSGQSLAELMAGFRSEYFISGEINSTVADPTAVISRVRQRYVDGKIDELDGLSVDYPDWHFNLRASNTEPLLRLNLESLVSREDMEAKRDRLLGEIRDG